MKSSRAVPCLWVIAAVVLISGPAAASGDAGARGIPFPAPTDPLITNVEPLAAQPGQQVVINGVNFGAAPQVTFNGTAATIDGARPDKAALVVTVPVGANSGPLIVTNTTIPQASNAAGFTVLAGTYTPACTISGTVTDPGMAAVAGAIVFSIDATTERFAAADVTDMSGGYTLGLPAAGIYGIGFIPPAGDPYVEFFTAVSCPTTVDHPFVAGSLLSGTVRSAVMPFDPLPNASVEVQGVADSFNTVTDATGNFGIHVPDGTYDLFVIGPVGGRHVYTDLSGVVVSGATSAGNIDLASGFILAGMAQAVDGSASGPLVDADAELFDDLGGLAGLTTTIVDGSFFIAAPAGLDYVLLVNGSDVGFEDLSAPFVDLVGDRTLAETLSVYSSASQAPELPTVVAADGAAVQEGQPLAFDAVNLSGTTVDVRFPDGLGGSIDGVGTVVDADRALIATRVPTGAVSGSIRIRVDGVDGPGYPMTIAPGVFDPGSFTLSGVVSDGASPVAGTLVALLQPGCDTEVVVDFDVSDGGGNYSLNHAGGDYFLFALPPPATGLTLTGNPAFGLTGNQTLDLTLAAGNAVTARFVDSGVGPVGAMGAPIENGLLDAEGGGPDDGSLTAADGTVTLRLVSGDYDVFAEGPFASRYLEVSGMTSVSGPVDLGDVALDSGFFVEGRVVDDVGTGVAGVEVRARDMAFVETGGTRSGENGRFRLAVPAGTYRLTFDPRDAADVIFPEVGDLTVFSDTVLVAPVQGAAAGHLQGSVFLDDGVTPVEDVTVLVLDDLQTEFITATSTCADGSYDLRVPSGDFVVQVFASNVDPCLADEYYDGRYYGCEADVLSVTAPATVAGLDFTLDPAGSISGRVQDDFGGGLGGVSVCVDGGPLGPACKLRCIGAAPDGTYSLTNVPLGSGYRVDFTAGFFPQECWDDHVGCGSFDAIPVGDCRDTFGIDATLSSVPGAVSDGTFVAGDQMTAGYDRTTDELIVDWQPTCSAAGHVLYFGDLASFGTYTQAVCDIGVSGTARVSAPTGSAYFVLTGINSFNEGSYGRDSNGVERVSAGGAFCGYAQDLSAVCLPGTTVCGDGVREGAEVCDGMDLAGQTCSGLGFDAGDLACGFACNGFDTADCVTYQCGNGIQEPGEECDDNNTDSGDGCQGNCLLPICGDGIVDALGQSQERVADSGFESWSGGSPVEWSTFPAGGTITQALADPHTGTSSAVVERTGSGSLGVHQTVGGLEPGRIYELSGWTRVDPGGTTTGFPTVRLRNTRTNEYLAATGAWGPTANLVLGGVAGDGSWTQFSVRFRTETTHLPADGYQILLLHQFNSPIGSRVYHDDVSLAGPLDEECDDGNTTSGDGCEGNCMNP